jgi:hypothetical protein
MNSSHQGLTIALTPVRLAAVLVEETIDDHASLTNRLWGSLRLAGRVLELIGAGVLCLAPEPTMASKSGCVLLAAHGADGSAAGARQAWTGRDTQSLTQQGSAALARFMGMDPGRAEQIGAFVDIVVPLGAAAGFGAARVAAIRSGRIHLTEHGAVAGSRIGGHTLARHVGRTEAQLRARLAAEPQIPMASSFSSVRTAERAVSRVLRVHAGTVRSWAQTAGQGSRLSLTLDMGTPAGHGVLRSSGRVQTLSKVQVVLKHETYDGKPYYVLTAFLIP